mgnify:CR=1 FL=1
MSLKFLKGSGTPMPKEFIPVCFQVRLVTTVSLAVSLACSEGWRPESTGSGVVISHLVECTVYADVHCRTPESIEDGVVQYSAAPILYCDMYSVHRTLLFARGLLRTPPLPHFPSL